MNDGEDARQKEEFGDRFTSLTKDDTDDADDARDTHDTTDADDTDDMNATPDTEHTADALDTDDANGTPVREQQRKTLYLPEALVDEAELAFDALNLRWRQEGNDPLEKHPDFYEQLLRNALDELGDVQERDLDELADELDLTDGGGLD
ncbi:hypothetical protein [Natrialba aegyptia]|uniref:hypothetical protein n=1 Tax=Natrialba aegyptia TaxID=129789 RepID=UPI00403B0074